MAQSTAAARHPLAGKDIVIAGAGLAGLAFARALEQNWPKDAKRPQVSIYERREKKVSPDREGYSISIRSDAVSGGMQALQKLRLLDETIAASITGKQGGIGRFKVFDTNWKPILTFKKPKVPPDGLPLDSMRIARYVLRQHLIDALPETVESHWGAGCSSAAKLEDGRIRVTFDDGSTKDCDLLVAADGASSKIRAALRPSDTLSYAGAYSISAISKFPDGLPPTIREDYGMVVGGGSASVFASPIDEHSAIWSVSMLEKEPRDVQNTRNTDDKDGLIAEAREKGKGFAQPFGALVDATDPSTLMAFNAMDKQPIDHSEMGGLPVVFIGDSNHAVSPFAGNGANMALMDGVDLAAELSNPQGISSAIAAFDRKSRARSKRTIDISHLVIRIVHSSGWSLWMWTWFLTFVNFLMSF